MSKLYKIRVRQTVDFEAFIEASSLADAGENSAMVKASDSNAESWFNDSRDVTEATKEEASKFYG